MKNDIQIPVTVGGVTFKNPFYVASGPTTRTVRQLQRIEETGWAAASIKLSVDPPPYINRKPRYGLFKDRDALAFTTEKRLNLEEGIKLVLDAKKVLTDLKLMANITYAGDKGPEGWVNMARRFQEAGADVIELNMCCPNMSYNLELTSAGTQSASAQTGASMGQKADVAAEIVRAVKNAIDIPLFVKLTPEGGQIAKVARALYEAGADAVGGTGNRMGLPPINLDHPEKSFFHLQDEISMSCYCSSWLKPLAQRDTYEIRKLCGKQPVIMATGGVTNWRDAVEMVMCGGNMVGICAETLISGYDIVRPMIRGMKDYMDSQGCNSIDDLRSIIVDDVKTATEVTLHSGYARIKEPRISAPCKSACPHHVPVQAYVQKIARGDYAGAYETLTSKGPFQSVCSLICTHPCEDACVRGKAGRPVQIKELKRFVFDYANKNGLKPKYASSAQNGHKVAVIGSGPAGLSCAVELRLAGYDVTVFEKENNLGGGIRFGIPSFRMDKGYLEAELEDIRSMGIEFVMGTQYGTDVTDASLKAQGFERVFVASGAQTLQDEGFLELREFMKKLACGRAEVMKTAVILGKTYIAIDGARAARRLGAEKVYLVFDKLTGAMSHVSEQLARAREEGIFVLEKTTLSQISDGKVLLKNEADIEFAIEADSLISEGKRKPAIKVDFCTLDTGDGFVFAGGDAVRTSNVISAVAAGKRAAAFIDKAIRGELATLQDSEQTITVTHDQVLKRFGYLKDEKPSFTLIEVGGDERASSFDTYTRVMSEAEACSEAKRCLNCGCGEGCQLCKTICTDFAPKIESPDKMCIDKKDCVACGMCFNRCPNNNIEMVDTGEIL